jgi:probable phosphomutase (TIGR03848 family)
MTTFLLIRHGETDDLGKALSGRRPGVSLNAAGRRQAEQLAARLAGEGLTGVYSGPLQRVRETAAPLAHRLGLEVRAAPELDEIDLGEWSGQSFDELAGRDDWRLFNTVRSCTRAPGGELILEVQARSVAFLQRLRCEQPGAAVALVSHADVIKAVLTYYLGVPLDLAQRLEVSPASVSVLALEEWGPRVLCVNSVEP